MAVTLGNFASFLAAAGTVEEAEPMTRRALEMAGAHFGRGDPETLRNVALLARIHLAQGKGRSAEQLYPRGLEAAGEKERPAMAEGLSAAFQMQGRTTEAEKVRKRFGLGPQ
jgi:hypothetical protein